MKKLQLMMTYLSEQPWRESDTREDQIPTWKSRINRDRIERDQHHLGQEMTQSDAGKYQRSGNRATWNHNWESSNRAGYYQDANRPDRKNLGGKATEILDSKEIIYSTYKHMKTKTHPGIWLQVLRGRETFESTRKIHSACSKNKHKKRNEHENQHK